MRPILVFLQTQYLLSAFIGVCMPGVVGSLPQALPWHVSCPSRCVCQIKPWFSPDSVYHEAPTVDCSDLLLTKLPLLIPTNTHTLRLQSNLLSELETAVLHGLPNLTDLDLSQNRFSHVRAITQSSPQPALLSLHLEENHISRLPDASFSTLPTLQELFLSHNNLQSIAPGAFAGLDSLMRLHINNNRLTTVDPQWFRALPRLEVLMLGGNPMEVLHCELCFLALKSLRSLVLGGMGLRRLAEKSLEGLESLESLSFYDNLLIKVPTQALRRVPGLKFLDLNKNRIKLIETGDFRDMIHLKELGLNNMEELVSIERAALENLPELTKLEITNNPRLSYIHPQAFLQLTRLESLMLNSNSLSTLHQHIMLSLPSLQEVSLHSNPLRCDCLFHWAAKEASHPHTEDTQTDTQTPQKVRFIQPQATLCTEPPELRARRVREVSSREMSASCLPMIPTSSLPSYVGVREGGKLVLHCRALADPHPELYWVTPSGLRLGPAQSHASTDLPAPAPCYTLIASEGFNTFASSISPSQPPDVTTCNISKHYRLLPEGTLELNKVTLREAGLYTCIAENALGADTRSVTVGVHGRDKKRKRGVAFNMKKYQLIRVNAKFEVREVGQHYAVLSWQSGRNLPSTRLSWQAIYSNTYKPTYTTRILAGTQSFNLTHLRAETFYRVCLHLGIGKGAKHTSSRSRESRETQCVSFMTKDVPELRPSLQLNPELTSTAITLLLLTLIMLLLAAQGWDTDPSEGAGKQHNTLIKEIKSPKALIISQKTEKSDELQLKQIENLQLHQDC